MKKLVLIDGNSLINRAFYATPAFSTKDGTPTNAVFGFVNMLIKLIGTESPEYIAVAFDVHHPTFRHGMYTEYKGTRKPMPEDLRPQIPLLKEVLSQMGIYTVEKPGFEADDLIGTIAKGTSVKTIIITGDRDSFQLVDEETEVHFTKRGITDVDVLSIDNFKEKTGITPMQVIELKALMGDSSDNIPGVKGIGEKTALSMVQTYGDIETLYNTIDDFKGKTKEKLIDGKDMAKLSKTLATIDTKVDIEINLDKMKYQFPFPSSLKRKFFELDFKKFLAKESLFCQEDEVVSKDVVGNGFTPTTLEVVNDLATIDNLLKKDEFSVVIDKDIYIYPFGDKEYKIPLKANLFDEGFMLTEIVDKLNVLFNQKRLLVYLKKDLRHKLKGYGVDFSAQADDLALLKYLVDFSGREETLEDVIYAYDFDKNTPAYSQKVAFDRLIIRAKQENLLSLYTDVELPLSNVLYDMECAGFKVDENALNDLSATYRAKLVTLEQNIKNLAGDDSFNINSPKQLGIVLFEKLGLPYPKRKKDGAYSTAQEILEGLAGDYPIIDEILKYRQLQKLVSTYIDGFKPVIERGTGLIHTSFNQTVTATGRLSSKAPNLQNIPVRDEEGKIIRKFFVARDDDHILVGADYSQIELRLLASFSGCQTLIDAYGRGEDIHTQTASKVFDVDVKDVTPSIRRDAKAVNFGIIYGISEYGLAKNIKTSNAVARDYIKKYFETYPEAKEYMNSNVSLAREQGFLTTYFNRRRYFPDINAKNFTVRSYAERAAMNMPLQGTSADVIKIAMINVDKRLKAEGLKSKLILQIHDELIVDAFKTEQEQVKRILIEEMEGAANLSVKLTVETEVGKNWFEAK